MMPMRSAISSAMLSWWVERKTVAAPPGALLQDILHHPGVLRVQPDHRLVNNKDFRVVQQGRDNGHPLARAVGKPLNRFVDKVLEVEARNQFAAGR